MAKMTRKRFLALGVGVTTSVAMAIGCAGGSDGSGSTGGGDDDDAAGDDDDDGGIPTPTDSSAPTITPTNTSSSTPTATPSPTPTPTFGDCMANGATAIAFSGHAGHTLTVPKEDVLAGAQKAYSIQGASAHDHIVTLTSADFAQLQQNFQIVKTSSAGGGHTHSVTIRCA